MSDLVFALVLEVVAIDAFVSDVPTVAITFGAGAILFGSLWEV